MTGSWKMRSVLPAHSDVPLNAQSSPAGADNSIWHFLTVQVTQVELFDNTDIGMS